MTAVRFHNADGVLTGFEAEGHAGFACEGEDIVCAAVTSAVRLTECALSEVLGIALDVETRDADAFLKISLPDGLGRTLAEAAQTQLLSLIHIFLPLCTGWPRPRSPLMRNFPALGKFTIYLW